MQNELGNNISMDCEQDGGNLHWYKVELLSTLASGSRTYNKHYEPTGISVYTVSPPWGQFSDYIFLFMERKCSVFCMLEFAVRFAGY